MAKKNKNKIRILDSNQDLNDLFMEKPDNSSKDTNTPHNPLKKFKISNNLSKSNSEPEMTTEEFAALLDTSLKGKNMTKMLQEKKEKKGCYKIPLKKRLKRYPPPEARLDLHGYTGDGAKIKTDSYINTAFEKGMFTIKIIVGKGIHSEFGAVLPGIVEDQLVKLKNKGLILHFEWEKKKRSQSGALLVYLNQFND